MTVGDVGTSLPELQQLWAQQDVHGLPALLHAQEMYFALVPLFTSALIFHKGYLAVGVL